MNARKAAGNAATGAVAPAQRADALPGIELHLAKQAAVCPAPAFPCKPKQLAHVARWLVATAALARTVRWPFPEVKPSPFQVPDVRGSRASTDPSTPPDLLNPPKGLSMVKTARFLLRPESKFVPVAALLDSPKSNRGIPRKFMIHRSYTLCEFDQKAGKNCSRQNRPVPPL
jgi:hypothetical protein